MSNGVRYTPTFAMPSEYEQAAAEARRRRRMAEMLAAQAYQPQEGGVAPIPSAAPLVQGLQAFLTARQARKAEEAEEKAAKADIEGMAELQRSLGPQERAAGPDMFADPMEMTSKYATPRMETYMPSSEERQAILDRAFISGSPRTQRLAELMMARDQQKSDGKVMEFGGQLLNISGGSATPVMMGGKPVAAPTAAEAPKVHGNLQWNATSGKWEKIPEYTPGGGTSVTVKLPGDKTRDVYSEKLSEGLAGQDLAVIEAGNQAIPRIEMSYNVRDLLAQNPITGFAAEQRLGFEKALAAAGFVKGDRASITENLAATLAKTTLGVVRTSGLGSGQGFTDKDREFLEKAAAGKIDLSSANLNYLAELNEKAARYDIQRSNQVRSRLRQMPNFQQMPGALPDIVAPPSYSTRKFKVIRPGQ